ncbi:hypothetical protein NE619_10905 [Anaerovorax odorimutans]|uniref:Uncharacterized protein n=1 Tax=Anaerovorax odorimutans TaxID=109327 RepID=A0ABT1RPZ0_9FIRM|nr:hypothetical protein [Anaerovorax odorimutans]MCQ4637231.1 hypothetical protein [Anaerovorax odorimutans]
MKNFNIRRNIHPVLIKSSHSTNFDTTTDTSIDTTAAATIDMTIDATMAVAIGTTIDTMETAITAAPHAAHAPGGKAPRVIP